MKYKAKKPKVRMVLSEHIVIDPEICHGKPTFNGTRIMVWQVLNRVAEGMPFHEIVDQWPGSFPEGAVVEAVLLAKQAFLDHAHEYGQAAQSA